MSGFNNGIVYADNINLSSAGQFASDGQLLIGSSVGPNVRLATLTAGANVTITNGNGTITIASTGGGGGGGGSVNSVSGTANRISSTGGANPVIDIDAAYVGQASITTLGTITTGVWNGTAVNETHGGTNQTSYTTGDTLYASGSNTLSKLAVSTFKGNPIASDGSVPVYLNPLQYLYFVDDFLGTTQSDLGWRNTTGGTTGAIAYNTATDLNTNPGQFELKTGTNAAGFSGLELSNGQAQGFMKVGGGAISATFIAKLSALSTGVDTYSTWVGFCDSNQPPGVGAWFSYSDSGATPNWVINARQSSTTSSTSNTAVTTGWTKFRIEINAAGTSISYFINDVELNVSPLSTNLPTGPTFANFGILKSLGATSVSLFADFFSYYQKLTASR